MSSTGSDRPTEIVPLSQVGASTTTVAPAKKPAAPTRTPKQLPPYRVLLHNDEVNTFEHVIRSILRLIPMSPRKAVITTLEAHESGVALLLVTHQERAELYQEQFGSLQLTVTIEPA